MKVNQSRATRVALLAASSFAALALAAPVAAQGGAWSVDNDRLNAADRLNASEALRSMVKRTPTPTFEIVTNDGGFITPGTGVTIPGSNPPAIVPGSDYANSADVLSTGVNGVGQMLSISLPYISFCTGTLINPRTVITAAHCVYDEPRELSAATPALAGA